MPQMTSDHIAQVIADKNYLRTMRTFQENFDMSHRQLLDTLNAYAVVESDPHLSNLCCRLDYNMVSGPCRPNSTSLPSESGAMVAVLQQVLRGWWTGACKAVGQDGCADHKVAARSGSGSSEELNLITVLAEAREPVAAAQPLFFVVVFL